MEVEEYRQAVSEGWGEAARLVSLLGWVVMGAFGAIGLFVLLGAAAGREWDVGRVGRGAAAVGRFLASAVGGLVGLLAVALSGPARLPGFSLPTSLGGSWSRWVLRRRAVALVAAGVTVAVGVYLGAFFGRCRVVFTLRGGRFHRERRYWYLRPLPIRVALYRLTAPPLTREERLERALREHERRRIGSREPPPPDPGPPRWLG